jgi:hypothetical protein
MFTGLIDNVRVYSRALSASEISTDMTTPISARALPTQGPAAPLNGEPLTPQALAPAVGAAVTPPERGLTAAFLIGQTQGVTRASGPPSLAPEARPEFRATQFTEADWPPDRASFGPPPPARRPAAVRAIDWIFGAGLPGDGEEPWNASRTKEL